MSSSSGDMSVKDIDGDLDLNAAGDIHAINIDGSLTVIARNLGLDQVTGALDARIKEKIEGKGQFTDGRIRAKSVHLKVLEGSTVARGMSV